MGRLLSRLRDWVVGTYDRIPRIWKTAYLLICLWYLFNYVVSALFQWQLFETYNDEVFWNTLYLYEALCVAIIIIFL